MACLGCSGEHQTTLRTWPAFFCPAIESQRFLHGYPPADYLLAIAPKYSVRILAVYAPPGFLRHILLFPLRICLKSPNEPLQ